MPARHSPHVVRFALFKIWRIGKGRFYGPRQTTHLTVSFTLLGRDRMIHQRSPGIGFRQVLYFSRISRDDHTLCHASGGLGSRGASSGLWWNTRVFLLLLFQPAQLGIAQMLESVPGGWGRIMSYFTTREGLIFRGGARQKGR